MRYILFGLVGGLVLIALMGALDTTLDNRDRMLCNSAKVSGNEIYLDKCICFYGGDDIRCIYKEAK